MKRKVRFGVLGYGNIGEEIVDFICNELSDRVSLSGICDIDRNRRNIFRRKIKGNILSLKDLIERSDFIIECASIEAAKNLLEQVVPYRKKIIIVSIGVFVLYPEFMIRIKDSSSIFYLPSGAICGIDGIQAMGKIRRIKLITSKPPGALSVSQKERGYKSHLNKERVVFQGGIKEAVEKFPRNINVAATLFLASGCENIKVLIKVKPSLRYNIHQIQVVSDYGKINIKIENFPSPNNPKTSYQTILSLKALIRKVLSNIRIGT